MKRAPVRPGRHHAGPIRALPVLALAIALGGCATAAPGSPASPSGDPTVDASVDAAGSAPPSAPAQDGPPPVTLALAGGTSVVGDLGSFTWDGLVSDSGWIIGHAAIRTTADTPIVGSTDRRPPIATWRARVAPIRDGAAGTPMLLSRGAGSRISFGAPGTGRWSLELQVDYGLAGQAAWYWQLDVGP